MKLAVVSGHTHRVVCRLGIGERIRPQTSRSVPVHLLDVSHLAGCDFLDKLRPDWSEHLEGQAHRRAALDLQINLLAEQEMTTVLRTVSAIARHLKIADMPGSDDELKELAARTDVVAIAKSVEAQEDSRALCEPPSNGSV